MTQQLTAKEFNQLVKQTKKRVTKYGNKRTERGQISFHSKLEARYYDHLKWLQNSGLITIILRQVKLELIATTYVADFLTLSKYGWEFIDTKGYDTDISRLKRKQVKEIYGIEIKIVTNEDF